MPFGLAGLAVTWLRMADDRRAPQAVGDALLAVALVAWLLVLVGYLRYILSVRSALVHDLLDPVAAPFASLALITPMLLAVDGVYPIGLALRRSDQSPSLRRDCPTTRAGDLVSSRRSLPIHIWRPPWFSGGSRRGPSAGESRGAVARAGASGVRAPHSRAGGAERRGTGRRGEPGQLGS